MGKRQARTSDSDSATAGTTVTRKRMAFSAAAGCSMKALPVVELT